MATLSLEERKERMNELRKAHFYMGFDQGNHISDYKENYTEKELQRQKRPENTEQQEFDTYRKNPRKTHYDLGTDNIKNEYQSIAKQSYLGYEKSEQVALSEDTKNDLRRHHFQLGFHSVNDPSEYKREFLEKQNAKADIDQNVMKAFLRKHNHDFGDRDHYYNTTYDLSHNKPYNKVVHREFLSQALNKEQLRNKTTELRKTNIVIGNVTKNRSIQLFLPQQGPAFVSQNTAIYNNKPIASGAANEQMRQFLKESHTVLGTDEVGGVRSVNSTTYTGGQIVNPVRVNKEQLRDFRSSHFQLAVQKSSIPESTAQSAFANTGQQSIQQEKPILQKSNFYIDQGLTKNEQMDQYSSVYQRGIGGGVPLNPPDFKSGSHASSIKFGSDPVDATHYQSEVSKKYLNIFKTRQQSFVPYPGHEKISLNQKVVNDLRKHHYELGNDQTDWHTHNHEYNATGKRTQLDEQTMKDLRSHHFRYGNDRGSYYLHSWEYGSKQGPPNKLDQEKADDLKKNHFKETDQIDYRTSYQVQTANLPK